MTKVLIVEDEESMADPLAFLLRPRGFQYGDRHQRPGRPCRPMTGNGADIVLLDVMLPGMSGTEVCKQLGPAGQSR